MYLHCGCLISNFKSISIMNHMKKHFSLEPRRAILTRPSVSDLEKVGGDIKFMPTCVWLKMTNNTQNTIKSILLDCYLILLLSIVHIISVEYQLSSRLVFILFNCIFLVSSLVFDLFFFSYSLLFLSPFQFIAVRHQTDVEKQ